MEVKINIFYIDEDPVQAARWMVDKHIVKMILESAQLLSTAHRFLDGKEKQVLTDKGRRMKRWILEDQREPVLCLATHINHPSAVWARTSVENYNWLVDHMYALMAEYTHRYEREHVYYGDMSYMLQSPPHNLKEFDSTKMPSAMDVKYIISDNPVENYRNYYKYGKASMHKWTNREPPEWIKD